MKAFLLAAGVGNRISRMIVDVPKSTLPIQDKPLIRSTVERLLSMGMEIVVIVGYQKEKIYETLEGLNVTYYVNPFYDITNSIASLWFAKEELKGEALIMNADVFVSDKILEDLLLDKRDNVMAIDVTRTKTGDYFFSTTGNGTIRKYGKDLPLQERSCEYVGIAKISQQFISQFKNRLEQLIDNQNYNLWWENVLYSFTDKDEHPIYTLDVKKEFWSEIDYFDDYERILNYIGGESHKCEGET